MKKIQLKSIIWKEGKHYVAQCLNVDVSSFGKSRKEALANLEEAIGLYFEDFDSDIVKVERPELLTCSLKYA